MQADVGVAADIQRGYDEVMKAFGKVDIIVNNAGTSRAMPFEKVTDEILHVDIEQKLFAAVRLIRLVSPQMKERRWGRIINVLNIGAKAPRPNSMPTSVSRAAGMAMTKALSAEFAPHNVLVNAMLVGLIEADQHVQRAKPANVPLADYYKAPEGDSARPGRQGRRVRQSGLLPGVGAGRLHHRHRHQCRWRPLAGGVTGCELSLPARGGWRRRRRVGRDSVCPRLSHPARCARDPPLAGRDAVAPAGIEASRRAIPAAIARKINFALGK